MKIGFIGLGIMGKPRAKELLKAGYEAWAGNRGAIAKCYEYLTGIQSGR